MIRLPSNPTISLTFGNTRAMRIDLLYPLPKPHALMTAYEVERCRALRTKHTERACMLACYLVSVALVATIHWCW